MVVHRILSPIDRERQVEVIRGLDQVGTLNREYLLLVVLSCTIATFGLILNSAAVVIGAMLIAPLMSPILRCALALVRGDIKRAALALWTLAVGMTIAVGMSALLGWSVSSGTYNWLQELPSEVVNRTRPSLFDLVVALSGGTAAAYAMAQPRLSATLPGVAIATALMPPLCTAGIGLSQRRFDVGGGALLLFGVNLVAIVFAGSVCFAIMGFQPARHAERRAVLQRALLIEGAVMVAAVLVLSGFTVGFVQEAQQNRIIFSTLTTELSNGSPITLVNFDRAIVDDSLSIEATIRAPHDLSWSEAIRIQQVLATRLQRSVALRFLIVPVRSLDPLLPPSPTPTRDSQSPEPPTFTPTATPAPSPIPSQTPTVSSTAMPPTTTPTVIPTAKPAPTITPLPTPTAITIDYGIVDASDGVKLRHAPGLTALSSSALQPGTLVQFLGMQVTADGFTWTQVLVSDGRIGWIAAEYVVPYRRFVAP